MLNTQDLMDRQILAVIRERDELWRKRHTVIKLEEPIQRGWRRFYALSERATAREDRPVLEAILAEIGGEKVHHRADFRKAVRRGSRRLIEIEQPLKPIPLHHCKWVREKRRYVQQELPEAWQRYFRLEMQLLHGNRPERCWVFAEPSLFELKVEKNWQWEYTEVDPEIENRLSELEQWLAANNRIHRCDWLKGLSKRHWRDSKSRADIWQQSTRGEARQARAAYNAGWEVDPGASVRCLGISRHTPAGFGKTLFFQNHFSPFQAFYTL